jgi:hypothetical protein
VLLTDGGSAELGLLAMNLEDRHSRTGECNAVFCHICARHLRSITCKFVSQELFQKEDIFGVSTVNVERIRFNLVQQLLAKYGVELKP